MSSALTQSLSMVRGDSAPITIRSKRDCTSATSLVFTAKWKPLDADEDAVFQQPLGGGHLTVASATALTLSPHAQDTSTLTHRATLYFDVQAQWYDAEAGTVETDTVAKGTLAVEADITRATATAIPVHTTTQPLPLFVPTAYVSEQHDDGTVSITFQDDIITDNGDGTVTVTLPD